MFCNSHYDILIALNSDAQTAGLVKYQDPYPFGVDPSWRGSRSELPFLNSLKMKMSILLGVAQMNLGILLSYFNARFFGSSLDIRYCNSHPTFITINCQLAGGQKLNQLAIWVLGISLCHRSYFLTVFLGIFLSSSSSSGALVLRRTFIM